MFRYDQDLFQVKKIFGLSEYNIILIVFYEQK